VPIEIHCEQCGSKFRVAEKFAGKRVKCASCKGTITVPAAAEPAAGPLAEEPAAAKPAPAAPTPAVRKPAPKPSAAKGPPAAKKPAAAAAGDWYMQTQEGEQYGPVSKQDLDAWAAEGRLDATCQVLCEGWDQWKWAEEVFSQLAPTPAAPPQAAPVAVDDDDPLASLGLTDATPSPAAPVPVVPTAPAVTPVAPVGVAPMAAATTAAPTALVQPRRRAYPNLKFAAQVLPLCAWVAGGLGAGFALYAAYEFLSAFSEATKAGAPAWITIRMVLWFLGGETWILLASFLSFVGLRALAEWINLRLTKEHEDHVNAELLGKTAEAVVKVAESPHGRKP
jgi:predicted Zn finger-like uncharacterized protein